MDFNAPHAGFVIAAYAISALVLAAVIISVVGRDRKMRRDLDRQQKDATRDS
jgi:heme exporter protein CcmD